jgi:hypothetical protein
MRASRLAAMLAIAGCLTIGVRRIIAQSPSEGAELLQKLQSEGTSIEAKRQLLIIGKSRPEVRSYLASTLPKLIKAGPSSCAPNSNLDATWDSCPWYNAMDLAGQLKIGQAAPALAQWINWRSSPITGLPLEARLVFYPAARALADIGDPAIPSLQHVLYSGSASEHARVIQVLCIVNSPKARAVLREDLQHEQDSNLRTTINNRLERK